MAQAQAYDPPQGLPPPSLQTSHPQAGASSSSFQFTSPYPQPQYDYPTAHKRTRSEQSLTAGRPPSPTPSELEEINQPFFNLSPRKFITKEWLSKPKNIAILVAVVVLTVLTILIAVEHKQIEDWLRPAANWMRSLKFGWLIPVAILFVISFPPLFGHEIVAVLCGNVWGLWEGFGIVALGTLLGEVGNFYAFRYMCRARAEKLERDVWWYACLARTVREGGFIIAIVARLSAIPGHFTTAVFATAGMNIFVFLVAAILSSPKQFATVYVGVILEESASSTQPDTKSRIISDTVLGISIFITIAAGWYINKKMKAARIFVVRERRQREALKMGGIPGHRPGGASEYASTAHLPLTANNNDSTSTLGGTDDRRGPSPGTGVFNPHASDVELVAPNARPGASSTSLAPDRYAYEPRVGAQQWDDKGKAVGDGYGYQYGYGGGDRERRGGNGYDDPYAPSSFSSGPSSQTPRFQPPSTTSSTATITAQDQPFRPPSGPPPPSQYPPQDQPAYPIQKRIPPPAAPQPIRKAPISLLQSQTSSTPPVPLLPPPNAGAQLNSSPGFPNPQMPSSNVSTNQDSYPNPFGETSPEAHQTSFNINPTPIATGTRRYDEQGGDIEPESPFADVNAIRVQPPSIHSTQEPSIPGSAPGSQGGNLSAIPPSSSHSSPSSGASSSLPSSLPSAVSSLSPTASGQGQTSQRVAQQQQQFLGVKRYQLTDPGSGSASAETSPSGGNSSFYSADSRNNSPAKERADDEGLR